MNIPIPQAGLKRSSCMAVLLLAAAMPLVMAQTAPQLTAPSARITDEAMQADLRSYESLQQRIKALNDRGRPVRDYALAKAQCWLDVSFHEYTRNDRSNFPQAALSESEKLIRTMEAGGTPGRETALLDGATRLRPDLWERAAALQGHRGWRCAQHKVACAEVELVHAGNEDRQQGWRHAQPYVQIAEDLVGDAQQLAERCEPPVVAPPAPPFVAPPVPLPVPVPPPAPAGTKTVETVQLAVAVLFDFDRYETPSIRSFSLVQLQELMRKVQRENLIVQSVRLDGYADRLNGTKQGDYNLRLSEKRVATVQAELARLGVAPQLISGNANGDRKQLAACEQTFARVEQLRECLLPNRRVDVLIEARRP
jgi:OmpA-OmpF porin, OOP family